MSLAPAQINPMLPKACAPERDGRCVILRFHEGGPPSGRYYLCGGIAWPTLPSKAKEGEVSGFCVLCGRDERTGRIYVFDQGPFMTVQWLRKMSDTPEEQLDTEYPALAPILARAWSTFLARMFFWREDDIAQDWYLNQAIKAHDPAPIMPRIEPRDHEQAVAKVFMQDASMRLAYEPNSDVHLAIMEHESAETMPPALAALVSAIHGISLKRLGV